MAEIPILLDENIRFYVTIPIFFVVLCTNVLRSNLLRLFQSDPKVDMKNVKQNNLLTRSKTLRGNGQYLSEKAYKTKRAYFVKKDVGALMKPPKAQNPMDAMANPDPTATMGMMKSQMVFVVIQGGLAYWVSHLFDGFLVAKTPFPLTFKFKSMMQRGVNVASLEPGFVSSLCWYFFIMISGHSLIGLVQAIFDRGAVPDPNEIDPMQAMMGGPMMGGGMPGMGGPDMSKIYNQEREAHEIYNHEFLLENVETDLLRKWRQQGRAKA